MKLSEIFPKDWKDWEDTRGNLVEQHGWYTSLGWQFIVILTPEREDALTKNSHRIFLLQRVGAAQM